MVGPLWLVVTNIWGPYALTLSLNGLAPPSPHRLRVCGALIVLALLAQLPLGWRLGRQRALRAIPVLAGLGTACACFWYIAVMVTSTDPAGDDTAAVGLFFLAPPTLVLLAVLLLTGALAGRFLPEGRARS